MGRTSLYDVFCFELALSKERRKSKRKKKKGKKKINQRAKVMIKKSTFETEAKQIV